MQENIVYGTVTADGNVQINGRKYVLQRDFLPSILFLRIEKTESGYEAMLSVKAEDDTSFPLLHETVQLTISDDLLEQVEDFRNIRRHTDEPMRYVGSPKRSPEQTEMALSEAIYQNFFSGDVGTICWDFLHLLQSGKIAELILVISSEDEHIQNLPWEMTLSKLTVGSNNDLPKNNFGLIRSREKDLSRFNRQGPTAAIAPLKMLFIPALPENLPERSKLLEIEDEQRKIIEAVRQLEATGDQQPKLVMEILDVANLDEIKDALQKQSHDIIHISGHGAFVDGVKQGILYLENEDGDEQQVTGRELGEALRQFSSIKLLVLSACETAVGGSDGSTAEQMAAVGLPAVLAMRFSVTDKGARLFTEKLYQRLAYGDSLTKAMHDARQVLWEYVAKRRADAPTRAIAAEWFTPVLYQNQYVGSFLKQGEYNTQTFNRFYPKITFEKSEFTRLIGGGFIGRKRLLIQLRQCFKQGKHVCLYGLGGLGKTTTAEAFAEHYRRQNGHDTLFFRNGSEINEAVILDRVFEQWKYATKADEFLAQQLKAKLDNPQIAPEDKLKLLINNCLKGRSNIVIFDNFEDVQTTTDNTQQQAIASESLRAFIRHLLRHASSTCHILFTTRYKIADLDDLVTHLTIDKMTYAERYRYVNFSDTLRRIPIAKREILDRRLDGHPRAMNLLEGLLRNDTDFDLAQFDASIDSVETQIFDNLLLERIVSQLTDAERNVFTAASIFFSRSPLAALSVVMKVNPRELSQILTTLLNWSLCFWDEKEQIFELHALTRAWMRQHNLPSEKLFLEFSYSAGMFFFLNKNLLLAMPYYEQAEAWESYAVTALKLDEYYDSIGHYRKSMALAHKVLDKNISLKYNAGALNSIGLAYSRLGDYESALPYFEKSLIVLEDLVDETAKSGMLNNIAQLFRMQNNLFLSLKYCRRSLKISRLVNDKTIESGIYENISAIFFSKGNFDVALKYINKSLDKSREIEKVDGRISEARVLNSMAKIAIKQKDYLAALSHYRQSIKISETIRDNIEKAKTIFNLGILYFEHFHVRPKALRCFLYHDFVFRNMDSPFTEKSKENIASIRKQIGAERFNQIVQSFQNNPQSGSTP